MTITHSDPERQWFLYFKEKEIGPLSESEVILQLSSGQIDQGAYGYTEGMIDWALIKNIPVFSTLPENAPPKNVYSFESANIKKISEVVQLQAESPQPQPSESKVEVESNPTPALAPIQESPPKRKKGNRILAPILLGLLGVLALAYFLVNKEESLTQSVKRAARGFQSADSKKGAAHNPVGESPGAEKSAETTSGVFSWDELLQFRATQDKAGKPFRISSKNLGDKRPILVGALSPLLKFDGLDLALYSDNEKSLLPVPKVWILKVPVTEGFFSAGPFTIEGKELPAGVYHVMVAHKGDFLGEVGFEIGPWPNPAELASTKAALEKERLALAQKEKASLEIKLGEITAAISDLKALGKVAANGPRSLGTWRKSSAPWLEKMTQALAEQRNVLSGPMFYTDAQTLLYNFIVELNKSYEGLDLHARGGPKALQQKRGYGLGQLWLNLDQKQSILAGEIQKLMGPGTALAPLRIDEAIIKRGLLSQE